MAKSSEGNPILQHVEKLVLAVCLVIMAVTVVWYPMSPPTVPLDKQEMAPDKVDAYLVTLIDRMGASAKPTPVPPEPDYMAILHKLQAPDLSDSSWAMRDLATPRRWIPSDEGPLPGQNKLNLQALVDLIPKPGKPLVGIAAELRATDPPTEALVAHATAVYPLADLLDSWQVAMKDSVLAATVKIMDVRFQVQEAQEVLPDGNIVWGSPRDVEGVFRPVKDKDGNDAVAPTLPDVTENNSREVQKALNDFFLNAWDKNKAEPDYWDVLGPQHQWLPWRINLPWTELSAKVAVEPAGTGATHGGSVVQPVVPPQPPISPGPPLPPGPGGPAGAGGPPPINQGGQGPIPPGTGATPKTGSARLPGSVAPAPLPGGSKTAPVPTLVPSWDAQMTNLGKAQVWVHDASLEYQKTYRYRAQLVLLSPLYGHLGEVEPAEDAKKPTLETPWSDWSAPVKPPPQADLFLTGCAQQMKKVTMTVFSRCQGQRVSRPFDVKIGERIGEKVGDKIVKTIDVDVPDLQNPGKTIRKPCNFFTGYTLIDIDWDCTVFQNGIAIKTVEVVLVDEQGDLVVHNMALDIGSSEYKALQDETQTKRPPPPPKKEPTTKPVGGMKKPPVKPPPLKPVGPGGGHP